MYYITALVFSGRKNPVWEVPDDALSAALNLFEQAAMETDESPMEPMLGYNGLQIEQGNKLWHVCKGRIIYQLNNRTMLVKKDPGQRFEQLLLDTAPSEVAAFLRTVME